MLFNVTATFVAVLLFTYVHFFHSNCVVAAAFLRFTHTFQLNFTIIFIVVNFALFCGIKLQQKNWSVLVEDSVNKNGHK